jgi:hypothetical protein
MSHPGSSREHFIGGYHCVHLKCPGTLEAHHKFLLEEDEAECSICLAKDGVKVDPDIVPVKYYPPVEDFEIEYVGPMGYRKVEKRERGSQEQESAVQEQEVKEEDIEDWRSEQDFSDVDSVTSHWRLDVANEEVLKSPSPLKSTATPFSPHETPGKLTPNTSKHRELVNEQLAKLPYYRAQPLPRLHPAHLPHPHLQQPPQPPTFGVTRPPAHAFPVGDASPPLWSKHPLQPPPHWQSHINGIPKTDYMGWHPVSDPDSTTKEEEELTEQVLGDSVSAQEDGEQKVKRRKRRGKKKKGGDSESIAEEQEELTEQVLGSPVSAQGEGEQRVGRRKKRGKKKKKCPSELVQEDVT